MTVFSVYSYHYGFVTLADSLSSAIDFLIKNHYIVDKEVSKYYYASWSIENLEKEAAFWKTLPLEQLQKVFRNSYVFTEREVYTTEK